MTPGHDQVHTVGHNQVVLLVRSPLRIADDVRATDMNNLQFGLHLGWHPSASVPTEVVFVEGKPTGAAGVL